MHLHPMKARTLCVRIVVGHGKVNANGFRMNRGRSRSLDRESTVALNIRDVKRKLVKIASVVRQQPKLKEVGVKMGIWRMFVQRLMIMEMGVHQNVAGMDGRSHHNLVEGRTKIYESLVKGDNSLQAGTPQSFNVLMKEMQSLCLDVKMGDQDPLASAFSN